MALLIITGQNVNANVVSISNHDLILLVLFLGPNPTVEFSSVNDCHVSFKILHWDHGVLIFKSLHTILIPPADGTSQGRILVLLREEI